MKQARQVVAELGAACHDASAITRCLATAEALLSGDGSREWATPNSLPPASIYQVSIPCKCMEVTCMLLSGDYFVC